MNIYELMDIPTPEQEALSDNDIKDIIAPHLHMMLPDAPAQRELIPTDQLIAGATGRTATRQRPRLAAQQAIVDVKAMLDEMKRNQ